MSHSKQKSEFQRPKETRFLESDLSEMPSDITHKMQEFSETNLEREGEISRERKSIQ